MAAALFLGPAPVLAFPPLTAAEPVTRVTAQVTRQFSAASEVRHAQRQRDLVPASRPTFVKAPQYLATAQDRAKCNAVSLEEAGAEAEGPMASTFHRSSAAA